MNKNTVIKTILRKSVANKKLLLKHLTGQEKLNIISAITVDESVYNDIEKYSFIELYNLYSNDSRYSSIFKNASERFPIFSDLISVLSDNVEKEVKSYGNNPSITSFKRWAIKKATLDFYQETNIGVDTKIISTFGGDKLDSNFAPNQKQIYNKWLSILSDGVKNGNISDENFQEIATKGFGRGSSFEKQLDRYRESFVKDIWYKISGE